jgi:hypothetical protein
MTSKRRVTMNLRLVFFPFLDLVPIRPLMAVGTGEAPA